MIPAPKGPRRAAVLAVALSLLAAAPARAQVDDATRSAARALAEEGLALETGGDLRGAMAKFERALSLVQVPTLAVLAARCHARLGELVEASERYRQARAMTVGPELAAAYRAAQIEAQREAEAARAELVKRIPTLRIMLEGAAPADVELRIDGRVVPAALIGVDGPQNPGAHRIEVRRGAEIATAEAQLTEREHAQLVLTLRARDAAAPEGSGTGRVVGFVLAGVGGASLVAGGITWGLALGKKSDLEPRCPDGRCDPALKATLDTYTTLRTTTIVAVTGGAALLTGAVVTLLLQPSRAPKPASASLTPWVGLGAVGVRGAF